MDKSSLLLCADKEGQPILDENGKLIYYCSKTNALILETQSLCEAPMTENNNTTGKDITNQECDITNKKCTNEEIKEKMLEIANEDKFTNEMTLKLLEIVGTKVHHLNDKMHTKKKIWFDIATEMQNNGYLINYNGTKAADKCHQRWRNLEKMYRGHCQYMKSTGTGKKKPPKYFDEMHDLIGEKHSSQPVNLLDSLDNFSTTSDTCSSEVSEVTNNNENFPNTENIAPENNMSTKNASKKEKDNLKISSIFENVKKTVRPKKDNLSIVLKELHEQDIQIENQRFEKF